MYGTTATYQNTSDHQTKKGQASKSRGAAVINSLNG